jgi:hypothetical protein
MNHCPTCQQHFFASELSCPFCREPGRHGARGWQKAVLAGAAVALVAGCPMPMPAPVYGAPMPPTSPSPSASATPAPTTP